MKPRHAAICIFSYCILGVLAQDLVAKVNVLPTQAASLTQSPGAAPDKATRLLKTDLRLTDTELNFTISTEAEGSLSLFHVYLDTDVDSDTGYRPPSRKAGELGADYLIEGSTLHIWDGSDNHAAWSWKQVGSVNVSRGPEGMIECSVPLEKLRIKTRGRLRVLIETLTDKWEGADTLPRQGVWEVNLMESQESDAQPSRRTTAVPGPHSAVVSEVASLMQDGKTSVAKPESLIQGSASFDPNSLIVTAITEAEPNPALYHIYIDADLNSSTGFHPGTAAEGVGGADFLCEGAFLYAWDGGEDHGAWRWRKLAPVTVTRSDGGGIRVTVPRDRLNLQGKKAVQILIETINEKWEGRDTLPRNGTWQVNLP